MNHHLETILKLIQQSERLSADEKNAAAQAVGDAEKEFDKKNSDLEIEASLERVRAVALTMKQPDDVLNICKIMFSELQSLGFSDLRNALINFWDDARGSLLDYDYSDFAGGHIARLAYSSHPAFEKFQQRIRSATDAFAELIISESELDSWKKRRRSDGEYDDPRLESISALYYYFYSIGVGAIGISTFSSLTEEKLNVLKRFRNVFDLAYRRYMDVALAEAQSREAQIEVALERVRTKAMAMHKSDDLNAVVATVFEELDKLNLGVQRCGIGILNKETYRVDVWTTTVSDHGRTVQVTGDESMDIHPLLKGAYDAWLQQVDFSYVLRGKDLVEYYRALRTANFILPDSQQIVSEEEGLQQYYFNAIFQAGGLFAFRETEFPEEAKTVMKRFAGVFNLTYKRFLDLQKAEAQTQKALIETALERVRGRALAMQEPEELVEVARVLRNEMGLLGMEEIETGTVFIFDEETETAQLGFTAKDTFHPEKPVVSDNVTLDLKHTSVGRELLKFFRSEEIQIAIRMEGRRRREWIEYIYSLSPRANHVFGNNIQDKTYHLYKFSNGAVGAASPGDISGDSWDLLKRAASVFSLAYSRFKDLSKARIDLQNLKDEKKRSDSLLLNILPEEIASELKQFGKSYARKHEQVSIMFADIKGFSSIAENLSADELVTQLDECFRAFDHIVEKHGLEKIKTIGDAYVCACGLPKPVPDNAVKTVRAALDMLDFIKGFGMMKKIQNLPAFEFRVGIHTGPVITGVVGLKKFTYDIWGDAVNMAARMEQHGEAGKINISGSTYALIKDKFTCTPRGKIQAKNKGEVDMYFVEP